MENTFEMSSAQKNIESMMFTYAEKQLGNSGGYFQIQEDEVSFVTLILNEVPNVHRTLRLRYMGDGKMQYVPEDEIIIEKIEKQNTEVKSEIGSWINRSFEINGGSLYEFALFHFADGSWYVCEKFHHLLIDRVSVMILAGWQMKALADIKERGYENWKENLVPDERYLVQLQNPAKKMMSRQKTAEYLKKNFSDCSKKWLDCPVSISSEAGCIVRQLGVELTKKLREYAKANRVSVESVLCFIYLLERHMRKGVKQIVVGRMTSFRRREEKNIVGLFSRIMPISHVVSEAPPEEQCRQLNEKFLVSMRYADYSQVELRTVNPDACILYDTLISYHLQTSTDSESERYHWQKESCIDTPIRLWFDDRPDVISWECYYQKEHYSEEKICAMLERYVLLCEQLMEGRTMGEFTLLSKADRAAYRVLNGEKEVKPHRTVAQQFLKRCCETPPDEIILSDEKETWTIKETLAFFYQAVDWLGQKAGKNDVVGVCMKRSVMLPVWLLAIRHIGAAFLPIDSRDFCEKKEEYEKICRIMIEDKNSIVPDFSKKDCRELQERAKRDMEKEYPKETLQSERAYLLYTSGSTGTPKAVQISEYSLMCRLAWMKEKFGPGKVTMQKTVYTFDVSLWELFLSLIYGGKLYLLPQGEERMPDRILQEIQRKQVTRIHFVPSMLRVVLSEYQSRHYHRTEKCPLEEIFVSGEELTTELARETMTAFPNARLINLYGPTECTIDVSCHECERGEKVIPIGKAVSNTELFISSWEGENVLPVGAEGELCVRGDLVGMGYLGGDRGGYLPSFAEDGIRTYRTGDGAVLSPNGELHFLGRRDNQVKLRGMRIDTGSIESVLCSHPDIKGAFVCVRDNRLIACCCGPRKIEGLSEYVNKKLPVTHVPSIWYWVEKFPLNENGKLNTAQLIKKLEQETAKSEKTLHPVFRHGRVEKKIYDIVRKHLAGVSLLPEDNIFDAGLDSLTAMEMISELRENGWDCSFSLIYQNPTVASLAEKLSYGDYGEKVFGMEYMKKKSENTEIFLAVPYGGGTSESFAGFFSYLEKEGEDFDIAVVRPADFGEDSVETMAEKLCAALRNYGRITLLGYCVGSAVVTELAYQLQKEGKELRHVYILGSLPAKGLRITGKEIVPWDFMSDSKIANLLEKMQPSDSEIPDMRKKIPQFRKDTRRFFNYFGEKERRTDMVHAAHVPLTLFFGEKDYFTIGWKKNWRRWKKYFRGHFRVVCLRGEGHYFIGKIGGKIDFSNF